ncbi:MAG: restriction endonuclease subunit S [Nitrosarchaeum sp.]|uniref:restriction endonuclease subunit S n=1 Tax=Nitrosarchaeum sp. TaxID=2026886 RepID=UPI002DF3AE81|nr:restriction endonuclease subunit S [Nitrosarchaeum sp.]MEC4849116.1 restriction endonuclease subunit S [Nitrosarchaeum sp.]
MKKNNLPDGWIQTDIGSICLDSQYGWTTSANETGKIKFLRTTDITSGSINWKTVPYCKNNPDDLEKYLLKDGDIVISRAGSVGVSYLVESPPKAVFASYLIRFKPLINPKFFSYFLQSNQYWDSISEKKAGIALQNVNATKLKQILFPLAPLNEQKRIVTKIEVLFSKIDSVTILLNKIKLQLRRYEESLLNSAFEGTLTSNWRKNNPNLKSSFDLINEIQVMRNKQFEFEKDKNKQNKLKKTSQIYILGKHSQINSWMNVKLENLVYIAGRIGWRGLKADEYTTKGPLFLSAYNLTDGGLVDFNQVNHISKERYDESPEIQLQNNDILLIKDGSGIGKISIVKNLTQQATVNSSLLVIRSNEAFIPEFLFYFLYGPKLQNIVKERITGSAIPHLFQRDIKQFQLSLPPLEEQQMIVKIIENSLTNIRKTEEHISNELLKIRGLKMSILKQAFEGKLIPQDSNDESANVLLEKIKKKQNMIKN